MRHYYAADPAVGDRPEMTHVFHSLAERGIWVDRRVGRRTLAYRSGPEDRAAIYRIGRQLVHGDAAEFFHPLCSNVVGRGYRFDQAKEG